MQGRAELVEEAAPESLEEELQQCYEAQSRVSEQLVVEIAESRALKAMIQEKETAMVDLQNELAEVRDDCSHSKMDLEQKTKALELGVSENTELKAQLEHITIKAQFGLWVWKRCNKSE